MENLIQQLKDHLPPLFAGSELDRLTGNSLRWRTIQNIRTCRDYPSEKRIPANCFLKSGDRKLLIVRDPFLEWWMAQLSHPENPIGD